MECRTDPLPAVSDDAADARRVDRHRWRHAGKCWRTPACAYRITARARPGSRFHAPRRTRRHATGPRARDATVGLESARIRSHVDAPSLRDRAAARLAAP